MTTATTHAAIARAIDRANLHDDPLRHVLEAIGEAVSTLEEINQRVMSEEIVRELCRSAALGANEQALALVKAHEARGRAHEARGRWMRLAGLAVSVCAALGVGYAAGRGWV